MSDYPSLDICTGVFTCFWFSTWAYFYSYPFLLGIIFTLLVLGVLFAARNYWPNQLDIRSVYVISVFIGIITTIFIYVNRQILNLFYAPLDHPLIFGILTYMIAFIGLHTLKKIWIKNLPNSWVLSLTLYIGIIGVLIVFIITGKFSF